MQTRPPGSSAAWRLWGPVTVDTSDNWIQVKERERCLDVRKEEAAPEPVLIRGKAGRVEGKVGVAVADTEEWQPVRKAYVCVLNVDILSLMCAESHACRLSAQSVARPCAGVDR